MPQLQTIYNYSTLNDLSYNFNMGDQYSLFSYYTLQGCCELASYIGGIIILVL